MFRGGGSCPVKLFIGTEARPVVRCCYHTMRTSQTHIAGVGLSTPQHGGDDLNRLAISAATKALLDAGVTYGDIDECFACFEGESRIPRSCFDTFGLQGAPTCEVDNSSGLSLAIQSIWSRRSNCSLVVGIDQGAAGGQSNKRSVVVAAVLVSDLFLTSHAYLKDGAVCIRGASMVDRIYSKTAGGQDDIRKAKAAVKSALSQAKLESKDVQILEEVGSGPKQDARSALENLKGASSNPVKSQAFSGSTGFASLCGLVWQLRGWAGDAGSEVRNCLQLTSSTNGAISVIVLARSDGRPALKWSEVENVRDGRERLGYNPAAEVRNISREDVEAVRTRENFVPASADVKQLGFGAKGGDRAALARL